MKRIIAVIVAIGMLTVGSVAVAQESAAERDGPSTQPAGVRVLVETAGEVVAGLGGGLVGGGIGL